ncbi:NnrU protein-domain-containing protein, partial [Pavlovales sp. CCMP2436]
LVGDDAASFSLAAQTVKSWTIFAAAVSAILGALYVFWIRNDTGYADDFVHGLETLSGGNSLLVNLALGTIFPLVHSGLATLRSAAEPIVGARAWRVLFACFSLPLSWTWIMYFIAHRYDGGQLYNLHAYPAVHVAVGAASVVSFFFLYPSTFNLLEVAAVDKPQLHLWETGVIRISRHPQMVGQLTWSAAHLLWLGTPFTAETMALLVAHHVFSAWNGDRRLAAKHGEAFEVIKARTSTVPFAAILDGRQVLPVDYWTEWARLPYAVIAVGCGGAYFAHPLMQGMAAFVENSGYSPGGLLG